ncbi:MAG: hypothetical protein K0Q95_426 [Bacteroidota bacterium]|jgi:hypothetical protein|nr:hypothetical protein [Bacteroidota bacterium]
MAQSASPDVISCSGNSFNNGGNQLDWTLGEPVTSTLSGGNNALSQGFHQPDLLITSLNELQLDYLLNVYPNPTTDIVHLQFTDLKVTVSIELFTSEGKLLESQKVNSNEAQLSLLKYKAGTYLLSVKESGSAAKTFRIIKSH